MPSRITISKSSAASVTVDFKIEDGTAVDLTGLTSQFAIGALGVNVTGTVVRRQRPRVVLDPCSIWRHRQRTIRRANLIER